MNLKDIPLKYSYETGKEDLLQDFYIPVLSCAKRYDRIAGFFSSTSLAISARGLAGLISRKGKMRLVTCQKINKEDAEIIAQSVENIEAIISRNFISEFEMIEDKFVRDHIEALGWMLANGYLEIKIALVYDKGKLCSEDEIISKAIMHQKVGILYDDDFYSISFSGSNNESASGWVKNIEEFKVFKEWELGQVEYFKGDQFKFNEFWNNTKAGVKVIDLPTAVSNKLIEESKGFYLEKISLNLYRDKNIKKKQEKQELKLFYYQEAAVCKWLENGKQLLLEMATGCGKTRTAIGCMNKILENNERCLFVVSCPQNTLARQWESDISGLIVKFDGKVFIDGSVPNWKTVLSKNVMQLKTGYYSNLIIFTTHQTCSSEFFIDVIKKLPDRIVRFLVGDEAHGLGANKSKKALINEYLYRLGLSATPKRWFDDAGSKIISDYFGSNSFEFTISDALSKLNPLTGKNFLVNYYYHPKFIALTEDELEQYSRLSEKIKKISTYKANDDNLQKTLEFMLFERANIEKNAEDKYQMLEEILNEIENDIEDTIIFVSDEQLSRVMKMLGQRQISAHKFTQEESTKTSDKYGGISEREFIIHKFKSKEYQVLVAIKCLDEGIDIPSAKRAIIMASSTNPREYIQRIGRVIRQADDKYQADIYDMILKPDVSTFLDGNMIELEKRIFRKEMDRVKDLSKNGLNNAIVSKEIYKILGGI